MNLARPLIGIIGASLALAVVWSSSAPAMQLNPNAPLPNGGDAFPLEGAAYDGQGVDPASGSYAVSSPAVSIGAPGGGGLVYAQSYTGNGWYHSIMGAIASDGGDRIVSLLGSVESFSSAGGGAYTPSRSNGSSLSYSSSTQIYTYTLRDGTVALYSADKAGDPALYGGDAANLVSITWPNGMRWDYHYSTETVVTQVWNPFLQQWMSVTAGPYYRLQSVTTNHGYQAHFEYGAADADDLSELIEWLRLDTVTMLNNAVDYCAPTANTCSFSKDWPELTISETTQERTYIDVLGRETVFSFDGDDLIVGIQYPGSTSDDVVVGYDGYNRVSTLNSGGLTWGYGYSDSGSVRTTTITNPANEDTIISSGLLTGLITHTENQLGEITEYWYDNNYRIEQIIFPEENELEYIYDSRGNVTETRQIAKPSSGLADIVTSATYPTSCSNPVTCNQPTSVTDAAGNTTTFTYDSTHGGLLTATQPSPDGVLPEPETVVQYAQFYAYYKNSSGSIVQAAYPIWQPEYTNTCRNGERPSCHGTVDQIRQRFTYGSTGVANNLHVTAQEVRANNGTLIATTTYAFDAVGNLIEVNPELNGTNDRTVFIYDDARQRVGVIGPDPDAGGPLTHGAQRTTYNDWGQPTQVEFGTVSNYTNWAGFTQIDRQTVTYDGAGRMTHARLIEGSATHALMQYSYDSAGRVDCVAQRMNPSTFASPPGSACTAATTGTYGPDRITRTTYDELNRRADVTTAYGTADAITEAAWTYTENGQVETLTDGAGNMYTYEYDAFDRLYRRRYPSPTTVGNSSTDDYEQFTYDAYGRLDTRRTRSGGTFSYDYDDLNRVTEVTAPGGMPTTTYTYDNHGRILTVSAGSDTITNTYNGRGWLASQTSAGRTVEYTYDVLGRRTRLDWPDSYYVTYTYTQGGQLSSIRENGASSGVGRLADFTYDQHGRRILLERGNNVDTDYAYDAASRLEELVHDLNGTSHDRTLDFSYNPAGQIISRTDSNTSYAWTGFADGTEDLTYDGLNRILSVTSQMATPDYDDRGNLIRDHHNQSYEYDEYNRLTVVGSTIDLAYDPVGRLAQTSGMGVTFREFLYDGISLIAEYDGSGTLQRRYVHGPGTDEPLVEYTSSSTSSRTWLMADERGSIVAITDGSGNATQVNTYDEYGDPGSGNAGRFGYTGQMWLPETGLYHYKARAYNPELGRFMQTDPIGINGGMNIYAYVGGDPVNATDPLGLTDSCTGTRLPVSERNCGDRNPSYGFRSLAGGGVVIGTGVRGGSSRDGTVQICDGDVCSAGRTGPVSFGVTSVWFSSGAWFPPPPCPVVICGIIADVTAVGSDSPTSIDLESSAPDFCDLSQKLVHHARQSIGLAADATVVVDISGTAGYGLSGQVGAFAFQNGSTGEWGFGTNAGLGLGLGASGTIAVGVTDGTPTVGSTALSFTVSVPTPSLVSISGSVQRGGGSLGASISTGGIPISVHGIRVFSVTQC